MPNSIRHRLLSSSFHQTGAEMRNRFLAITPFVLLGASIAAAADLSTPYKAPAPPLPYYNWSGFYGGLNLGGGFSDFRYTSADSVTGAPTGGNSVHANGVVGGGEIGYNFMYSPNFLAGVEVELSGANITGSVTSPSGAVGHIFDTEGFAAVRGRLGLTYNNWLFYGTGGVASGVSEGTRNQDIGTTGNANAVTSEVVRNSGWRAGWAAGAGIDWGISPNWITRVEYLYVDLGTTSFTFPLAGRTTRFDNTLNVFRFAVNYKL